jgi:DDE superfamily endonuclease/Helix-turn-helix of DDE superfamily endonuclease
MDHYARLRRKPSTFRQFTGLTVVEFDKLLAQLEPALVARQAKARRARSRKRKVGAGRKPKLAVADRLFVTLVYYRVYVAQAFLGGLFGVDAGTVCRLVAAVGLALTGIFRIPERKVTIAEDELAAAFVDATEQPTNRPSAKQRRHYSGKKKRHTIKHQVVVVRKRKRGRGKRKVRVAAVGKAASGKTHDKKMYDRSRLELPDGVRGTGDSGYQGTDLEVPHKRPRGGTLTRRQRAGNRRLSKRRIVVEHGIGKMKIWRIVADRFRNPRRKHTVIMKNVAGLHNLMFS